MGKAGVKQKHLQFHQPRPIGWVKEIMDCNGTTLKPAENYFSHA